MPRPAPADVWLIDPGLAAKVRPCLVLSDYPALEELALIIVVPHTTAIRGAILPGVVGAIALILALYLAAALPVNITGLALIVLALMLFIFDIYAPTHGVLTAGAIISFLIGSLMLFNHTDPLFRLSLTYIIPATLTTAAFLLFVVGTGLRAQRLPVKAGAETLIGKTVNAMSRVDASGGRVFVEGEYWNATSDTPIEQGEPVEITQIEGLTLKVKPK